MWKPNGNNFKNVATNIYQDNQLGTFQKNPVLFIMGDIIFLKRVFFLFVLQSNFVQKEGLGQLPNTLLICKLYNFAQCSIAML